MTDTTTQFHFQSDNIDIRLPAAFMLKLFKKYNLVDWNDQYDFEESLCNEMQEMIDYNHAKQVDLDRATRFKNGQYNDLEDGEIFE
jgi:hypothetical protein